MKTPVCRFAPSPSGVMHIGNIATSLLTWLDCRKNFGKLIFRMEDLDIDRCKKENAVKIADDLKWLGLDWDEGWDDLHSDYAQSSRTKLYDEAFELLLSKGLVYPCYCTRSQRLAASAPHPGEDPGAYECKCRYLSDVQRRELESSGRKPAWKIAVSDAEVSFCDLHYGDFTEKLSTTGDFIIKRSDGIYAYQLAVSVDDMDMNINRVVRGRDLLTSTAKQIWLIQQLGGEPPEYCHAPLLVNRDMRKMSKRYGDLSMEVLRAKYSPEELIGKLAFMVKLTRDDSPKTACDLIDIFSWDKVPCDDIIIR